MHEFSRPWEEVGTSAFGDPEAGQLLVIGVRSRGEGVVGVMGGVHVGEDIVDVEIHCGCVGEEWSGWW